MSRNSGLSLNLSDLNRPPVSPSTPRRRSLLPNMLRRKSTSTSPSLSDCSSPLVFENYEILNIIAQGTNSTIYRVLVDGIPLCMKKIDIRNTSIKVSKSFYEERELYELVPKHPNLVNYVGSLVSNTDLCLFTTPYDFSVYDLILGEPLKKEECDLIILNTAKGLKHLHNNQIIHRDVKPDNILVFMDKKDNIVRVSLGDMDNCKYIKFSYPITPVGTPGFTAPEVLNEKLVYQYSADVFSLGMTIYNLITGKLPYWELRNPHEIAEAILNGIKPTFMGCEPKPEYGTLVSIYKRATEYDPEKRISLDDIIGLLSS